MVDLGIISTLTLTGAKLSIMTQSLAYRAIRAQKIKREYKKRRRIEINIQITKAEATMLSGAEPSEESLWRAIKHKDILREARYFLWMTFHNAYMVGSNWLRPGFVPEYRERSECKQCHKTESMEHILVECDAPGQAVIWALAEEPWLKQRRTWPKPTLGTILVSAGLKLRNKNRDDEAGDTRLYWIIMSESVHIIWKIRCERVIREEPESITPAEAGRRWKHTIALRADLEKKMANPKYGKKALNRDLVKSTWKGIFDNENNIPDPPVAGETGVLVGSLWYDEEAC